MISKNIAGIETGTESKSLLEQIPTLFFECWYIYTLFILSVIYSFNSRLNSEKIENNIYNKPYVPAILNAIFLIVGIYTSVTSSSILKWLSPALNIKLAYSEYSFGVFLFIFSCVVFGHIKHFMCVSTCQNNKDEHIRKSEQELTNRINQLEKVIRLAPPNNFASQLCHYSDVLEDWSTNRVLETTCYDIDVADGLEDIKKALLEQQMYIRASVMAVTKLVGIYDNADLSLSSQDCYRGNLSFSIKDKKLSDAFIFDSTTSKNNKPTNKYRIKVSSEPNFRLFIDKRYSVCSENSDTSILHDENSDINTHKPKDFPIDKEIKNITFPVYISSDDDSIIYNVIGAPRAIATCQSQFIPNTIDSVTEWETQGAPRPLVDEAKAYFSQDKKGRSIISMPLAPNRYGKNSLKPENMAGTINIYRNTIGLFNSDQEKFNNFVHLVNPLLVSISRIVDYHSLTLETFQKVLDLEKLSKSGYIDSSNKGEKQYEQSTVCRKNEKNEAITRESSETA